MTPQEQDVIAQIMPAAKAAEAQTGVRADVTAAQCILESGWLRAMPAGTNNPFGIKAEHLDQPDTYSKAMTTEWVAGRLQHVEQPFQRYYDLNDAFADHARLISTAPRYAKAMAVRGDAQAFATALMNGGYSTNRPPLATRPPYYDEQLMQIISEFGLSTYELPPTA